MPALPWAAQLAISSNDHRHKLFDFATLFRLATRSNCMLYTVADVITKKFFFNPSKRRSDSRYLRDDVDAVPVLLHHSGEPSDLTLNPRQAFRA